MNLQSPNHFIENFKIELTKVKNTEYLIKNEIIQIELFTSKRDEHNDKSLFGSFLDNKTNSVFDLTYMGTKNFFNDVFHSYILNQNTDNFTVDFFNKSFYENALLFAEYYNWLKSLNTKSKNTINKNSLSHKQKMLVLYYLGLNISNSDNTKMAEILSKVLELNFDNTRKYLSYLSGRENEVRTVRNLNEVKKIFETNDFSDIVSIINKDIESIK